MKKKQNVPALRFQGFSGEWENFSLKDLSKEIIAGGDINKELIKDNGDFPVLGNALTNDGIVGYYDNEFRVKAPAVTITGRGDIGHAIARKVNFTPVIRLLSITTIHDVDFLANGINRSKFIAESTGIPQLTVPQVGKYKINIPSTTNEEERIGKCFVLLEKSVFEGNKKIQKLQQFRQAMLTKLFPREEAAEPELRFRGFSGKWEQRKLLENFQKIIDFRGRTPKKLGMDWSKEGYLALSALNVKDGYIDFKQECHYGSRELYDKWMAGNELHKGQVIFTTEAPMGNVAQIPDNKKYILSQRTIAFEVKPDLINEDFLAILLRTPQMFQKLSVLSSGGTAKGISQRSMEAVDAFFPIDILEQEKIGTFFKDLDSIISLQQKKLERMQRLKAALLDKMFV